MTTDSSLRLEHTLGKIMRGEDCYGLIAYELYPLINQNPELQSIFNDRVHYFENLSKSKEYRSLIEEIHATLAKAQPLIDHTKLPKISLNIFHNLRRDEGRRVRLEIPTYQKIHHYLATEEPWYRLGHISRSSEPQANDSKRCPWRNIIRQYEMIEDFFEEAVASEAADSEELGALQDRLKAYVTRLHELMLQPWEQLHIGSFEIVEEIATMVLRLVGKESDGKIRKIVRTKLQETQPMLRDIFQKEARKSAQDVVEDLLLALKTQQTAEKRTSKGKQPTVRWQGNGRLTFRSKEYQMAKNSIYANLCEKIYAHCRLVGSFVPTETLFEEVQGRKYLTDRLGNWRWLSNAVRSANRWAEKRDLPMLFKCEKEHVERLV